MSSMCAPWFGLIPACAGKTLTTFANVVMIPAHPRVCGEN